MQQPCLGLVQGGAFQTALQKRASSPPLHRTASTLISLSFANAWLNSSKRAWSRRSLTRSCRTTASPIAFTTASTRTTTRSLKRTLLSVLWLSFLINIFIGNSFWRKELVEHNELSQTVQSFPLDPLHDHLGKEHLCPDQLQQNLYIEKNKNNKLDHNQLRENTVPDRELRQLHLQQLHQQDQPFKGTKQLPKEHSFTSCLLRQMISNFSKKKLERLHLRSRLEQNLSKVQLVIYKFFPENFGQQLAEKQLQQNLSTDQPAILTRQPFSNSA